MMLNGRKPSRLSIDEEQAGQHVVVHGHDVVEPLQRLDGRVLTSGPVGNMRAKRARSVVGRINHERPYFPKW
jgi:hypothetical protein